MASTLYAASGPPIPDAPLSPMWVSIGGIVLNDTDSDGVRWTVSKLDGWGSPASTLEVTQRARGNGGTSSEASFRSRIMVMEGLINAPSLGALTAAEDAMIIAVSLEPIIMQVNEGGRLRWSMVQRQDDVILTKITSTLSRFSIQVVAPDPLKYGDELTASTGLPSSFGGLTYPVTYPIRYTGIADSGIIHLGNRGNAAAPVRLRIDGPIPAGGWSVTHVQKGAQLVFGASIALDVGEFVTVDMGRREVLAQGQASRNGYVTSRGWFDLDPGMNDIAFNANTYDPDAKLTVTSNPAWS